MVLPGADHVDDDDEFIYVRELDEKKKRELRRQQLQEQNDDYDMQMLTPILYDSVLENDGPLSPPHLVQKQKMLDFAISESCSFPPIPTMVDLPMLPSLDTPSQSRHEDDGVEESKDDVEDEEIAAALRPSAFVPYNKTATDAVLMLDGLLIHVENGVPSSPRRVLQPRSSNSSNHSSAKTFTPIIVESVSSPSSTPRNQQLSALADAMSTMYSSYESGEEERKEDDDYDVERRCYSSSSSAYMNEGDYHGVRYVDARHENFDSYYIAGQYGANTIVDNREAEETCIFEDAEYHREDFAVMKTSTPGAESFHPLVISPSYEDFIEAHNSSSNKAAAPSEEDDGIFDEVFRMFQSCFDCAPSMPQTTSSTQYPFRWGLSFERPTTG